MELEKSREILRILKTFNPWWDTGKTGGVEPFKRLDFWAIEKRLDDSEVIAIVGARQVGKTTLMQQTIENLLHRESAERILFVIADNSGLNAVSKNPIEDSLQAYQEFVLKQDLSRINQRVFVFIDEIQKTDDWPQTLKSWYDINKKIKFAVSGSSSIKIIADSTKPFVGRAMHQIIVPFKFAEILRFDKHLNKKDSENLSIINTRNALRDRLKETLSKKQIRKEDIRSMYLSFQDAYKFFALEETNIKGLLNQYLVKGGYPRIVTETDFKKCIESLTTNYRDVINSDIKSTHLIRKPHLMESLLVHLARNTSQITNMGKIGSDLGETGTIVSGYIKFLQDAFIVSASENFKYGKSARVRKKIKKFYVNDTGLRNVINNSFNESVIQDGGELGKLVETIVFNHCMRLKFHLTNREKPEMFYWRDGNEEIDIILDLAENVLPIEVKYRNNIEKADIKALQDFINNGKAPFGLVITLDKLGVDEKIIFVPLWLFLLMV